MYYLVNDKSNLNFILKSFLDSLFDLNKNVEIVALILFETITSE